VPFGQSVTVTGTVYNGGNAATGASFNNMFVTNLNAQGTAWNTAVTAAPVTSDLGVGGAATFSYTFPASTFAAPGTYPYADCVDVNAAWAGLINESNENNNCYSATIVITIPDLTAGSVTPTTATAGTPASLTATASNIGNATSGSFPMLFQVQSPAANVNSSYLAAIPAGSTGAGSASYTFPSAGTYQVRACANQNTSGTFIVTESNYGNNCGAWQSVIVTAAPVASGTISANPIACTAATTGGSCSTTVTWSSQNLSAAQVWVKVNGEATGAQMSGGTSGTNAVPWIAAGSYYDFVLYDYSSGSKGAQLSVVRVTGVNPAAADLTAGSVTPTTATAGTPRTLSATASNTGNAPSGSFPMLFQVSQTGALVNSAYVAAIPTGGSGSGTASYTFPSAGTYQVRACANNNTSWVNIVTESNYSNNCGAWTVVVVAAAVPPSVSCVVDQSSVPVGASVTYTATPANGATSPYTWVASDGASVGSASTATRTFAAPGNYAMTAKGSNTVAANCPMVSVAATWCTTATPALSITASSVRVKAGQTATISWSASGVNGQNATCTVTGPGVSWSSAVSAAPVCSVPSGSATPTINTQSTYTLSCGSQSKSVTVNVIPNFTEF
jgi:hypothetical protein